jgi:serine protease Do
MSHARDGQDLQLETSILLVKPAVVLISDETAADVAVDCGSGPVKQVQPDPIYETGSGFIIHPDGYIATNGHVVTQFYDMNERMLSQEFLEKAVVQACGPGLAQLPEQARKDRLQAIAAAPGNQGKVQLFKRLQVHLSTGEIYGAEVKAYSPAINPEELRAASERAAAGKKVEPERSGKDVAIIKIDARDLPTIRLAPTTASLKLGEQIFVLGYPGVVLNHDFLSRKSQLEASVTVGRVSGFKIDITNRRVIQTDAPITWGNSGGPAFNLRGEAIGVATFISTTVEGDQAIQGFNFLIPADSVREFAKQIGLTPESDTAFMREWTQGVTAYFAGEFRRSAAHTDAALKIMAGFPDVERLLADARMQTGMDPGPLGLRSGLGLGVAGAALAALAGVGFRAVRRRRSLNAEPTARFTPSEPTRPRHPARRRVPRRSGPPRPGRFHR